MNAQLLEIAKKHGYSNLFALKSAKQLKEEIDYALSVNDLNALPLIIPQVINFYAVELAKRDLELASCKNHAS